MTVLDITCPSCGTVSYFEELGRDAAAFCRSCDFPLFWARATRLAAEDTSGDVGLRRLPGTAGRVAIATIDCPSCEEPNPINNRICIRCGDDLRPPPPPPPAPPPRVEPVVHRPPPPPPPPKRVWWPWILLIALAIAAIVVLIVLLT
jgi:hypothetical protein